MSELDFSQARWRKSSRSGPNGDACVEVASVTGMLAVRDSKNPNGPRLAVGRGAASTFVGRVKGGRFDLP